MAYLTHNAYRSNAGSYAKAGIAIGGWSWIGIAAAIVVGGFVVVQSGAVPLGTSAASSQKGDRLAAVAATRSDARLSVTGDTIHDADGRVVYQIDSAQRTTTVARDSTIPLSKDSPYSRDFQ